MIKRFRKFVIWLLIFFFGSTVLSVVVFRYVPVFVTPLMVIRALSPEGTERQMERERHWHHHWVSVDDISPWMSKAVVASEDANFYSHFGFDFKEIRKAIDENRNGKRQRGASTISQQTAKNVFLWPGHSWLRKGLEAYFTVLIELFWSKDRIMEVYLNSIEMGAGIYGVEAAARYYFNTSASKLSKRQSILIAVSLPAPLRFDPANPSKYIQRRVRTISKYI